MVMEQGIDYESQVEGEQQLAQDIRALGKRLNELFDDLDSAALETDEVYERVAVEVKEENLCVWERLIEAMKNRD